MADEAGAVHKAAQTVELGATGLTIQGGYISEEFLRQLQGVRLYRALREMADNDDIVGAMFFAMEMLMRGCSWDVEPGGDSPDDQRAAEFLETVRNDMQHPWSDFLSEWMATPTFGFCPFEHVFKRRLGESRDPTRNSRHNDGMFGVRKLAVRYPDTVNRWLTDDRGEVIGFEQVAAPTYKPVGIPADRLLLFRIRSRKGSPEGVSLLRNAYLNYYEKKRLRSLRGIGHERNLAGFPVLYVPPQWMSPDASTADLSNYNTAKSLVRNIKVDEQAGVVLPSIIDPDTKERLVKLELLSVGGSGGGRQMASISADIDQLNRGMAMTITADVILLGHEKVGSFALASSKTNLFAAGLGALLDGIQDRLNRDLVPRLMSINGFRLERMPEFRHGDIETVPLEEIANLIEKLTGAGAPLFPDDELENHIRRTAGLPAIPQDRLEPLDIEPDIAALPEPQADDELDMAA